LVSVYVITCVMLLIAGIMTLLVSLLPVRDIWALRQPRLSIRFALPALIATTIIGCGVSAGLTIKYGAGIADLAAAAAVLGAGCLVWITARIGKVALREALRMTALERHRADHDTLTSLPNRAFFLQQLERAISRAAGQHRLAVLIMDLNRFKLINDTLGHFYGDTVLQEVGRRLQSRLRVNDLVGAWAVMSSWS
jgi:GGDEF domain-containing protein